MLSVDLIFQKPIAELFAGIYPREPRNKRKASKSSTPSTTFYYTKDIQYLLHEPLLNKFRDHKALAKKIAKSLGRGEVGDAARLERQEPKVSLDHIIKERYPTFVDALRDLDDALSMLFLFANLPSTSTVPPKTIAVCQRLCHEFEHYLITTHSLRKSFLSIKGIYYQATIQGQDILWLVPYKFVQRVTRDVDFRIMGTFVEFYITLLGFVNFRLYTSIGLVYPPKFNAASEEKGGELSAFTLEGRGVDEDATILERGLDEHDNNNAVSPPPENIALQKRIDAMQLPNEEDPQEQDSQPQTTPDTSVPIDEAASNAVDTFEPTGPDADILPLPQPLDTELTSLFTPFSFFLSRETPRHPLEFLLRAFGCKRISWDAVLGDGAFTHNEFDPSITHQVVDRPPAAPAPDNEHETEGAGAPKTRMPGRTYIQPQWVWDCINEGKLLRPDLYAPGATLPPHLSPWVKPTKGAYDPSAPLAEQEQDGEAEAEISNSEEKEEEEEKEKETRKAASKAHQPPSDESTLDPHGMAIAASSSSPSEQTSNPNPTSPAASSFSGFASSLSASASDAESDTSSTTQHQRELEAEALGQIYTDASRGSTGVPNLNPNPEDDGPKAKERRKRKRKEEEDEELERRKMMLGRKKRKLVEKMLFGNAAREEQAERLRAKRRRIESETKKSETKKKKLPGELRLQ